MEWIKRLFGRKQGEHRLESDDHSNRPTSPPTNPAEAQEYIRKVRTKIQHLAERFAEGGLNRRQFEELYEHYQNEIQQVEFFLVENPGGEDWKNLISEGQSVMIRRRHKARLVGYSIYENLSGMPLKTAGEFGVDPALFVPMLFAYQSATEEIFGARLRSTQIEGGKWLCFVPGSWSTTLALFNLEPAGKQLQVMEEVHKLFEAANKVHLLRPPVNQAALVCPQDFFLTHPL